MKVKALKLGFLFGRRIRPGEVFNIDDAMFSKRWMVKIEDAPKADVKAEEKKPGKKAGKVSADLNVI
jgi:hypothetical protein